MPTPALHEGRVDAAAGDRHLHVVDAATGEILWEVRLGDGPFVTNNTSGAPTIADGVVHVGSPSTKTLYALDLRTGEQLWTHDSGPVKAAPAVVDGLVVYTTTTGQIGAVEAGSGELVRVQELSTDPLAPAGPVIVDDVLLVPGQDGLVHTMTLDELRGPTVWDVAVPLLLGLVVAGALGALAARVLRRRRA
ncbi:PQQ-binding-like beta-propeller repeat protein [Kocuria sp. M1R5S2]|uniref:outer membrane protein assembly factor BamB family protein n=1 Tax=Kocuria rhizosphaerae TaxID=3376285 RepID=UPI00379F510F